MILFIDIFMPVIGNFNAQQCSIKVTGPMWNAQTLHTRLRKHMQFAAPFARISLPLMA
jgi:hypothetical protein